MLLGPRQPKDPLLHLTEAQLELAKAFRALDAMVKAGCVDSDIITARRRVYLALISCKYARKRFSDSDSKPEDDNT